MPLPLLRGGGPRHTRGPGGVMEAFPFQLPPSASQLMSVPLSPRPRERRPFSSLPCCRCVAPTAVIGRRLVTAPSVRSGERGDLFPHSVSNRSASHLFSVKLPRLLFVLPFKRLLLARSTGTSWRGSSCPALDAGPGHQVLPSQELDAVRLPLCPPIQKTQHAVARL